MKTLNWKTWGINQWVLEAADGEVLDEISRGLSDELFWVKSTSKKYTSLEAAKKAVLKSRDLKGEDE